MLNRNTKWTFILAASCAALALGMTGCRSMSGRGMFGMRGEPSAETLAGSGPTVTYPAPPSSKAKPEAIASVAGGTATPNLNVTSTPNQPATTQVSGLDVSPGYATQATNMAAAQANGVYSDRVTKPATFDTPATSYAPTTPAATSSAATTSPITNPLASESTKPSGYAFGSKAFTPKSGASSDSPTAYALSSDSGIASPTAPLTTPSTTSSAFAPPPLGEMAAATTSAPTTTQGFTLPTDSPSFSAITPPTTSTTPAVSPTTASTSVTDVATTAGDSQPDTEIAPAAAGPAFSTASAATNFTAPATTPSVLPSSIGVGGVTADGYMPGSTGSSSTYPTSGVSPTTNGSYYR